MPRISKEIPTGNTNGSNTVFTLVQPILQLDDVFVDGEIYLGTVTPSGSQITLADAPQTSILVDYYYAN